MEETWRVIGAQQYPPSWPVTLITALIEVNRPIKGCGGADKLCRTWPVLPGFWHSLGLLASWSWDLDPQRQAPGTPDVLGRNLWWHLQAGVRAHCDIHCSVWHEWSGVPASYQPPHIWLNEHCWKSCFLLWGLKEKKPKRRKHGTHCCAFLTVGEVHQNNTGLVASVAKKILPGKQKHNFLWSIRWNTNSTSLSMAACALRQLGLLFILEHSNAYLKWNEAALGNVCSKTTSTARKITVTEWGWRGGCSRVVLILDGAYLLSHLIFDLITEINVNFLGLKRDSFGIYCNIMAFTKLFWINHLLVIIVTFSTLKDSWVTFEITTTFWLCKNPHSSWTLPSFL